MATLYVENVPDDLYKALRARARERHRSIAAEVLSFAGRRCAHGKGASRPAGTLAQAGAGAVEGILPWGVPEYGRNAAAGQGAIIAGSALSFYCAGASAALLGSISPTRFTCAPTLRNFSSIRS